jgi:YD repeat-containing protein
MERLRHALDLLEPETELAGLNCSDRDDWTEAEWINCQIGMAEAKLSFALELLAKQPPPLAPPEPPPSPPSQLRATTTADALAVWEASIPIPGTPAKVYLTKTRKLALGDEFDDGRVLRWHAPSRALIALFRNIITDQPQAISRLSFDAQGRVIEDIDPDTGKKKKRRKSLGPTGGAAMKLSDDAEVTTGLHACEGFETGIDSLLRGYRPLWALGSCGGIERFPILDGVERLVIIGENDENGSNAGAAAKCADRWSEAGREAFVVHLDDPSFSDFNDFTRRATENGDE